MNFEAQGSLTGSCQRTYCWKKSSGKKRWPDGRVYEEMKRLSEDRCLLTSRIHWASSHGLAAGHAVVDSLALDMSQWTTV